MTRGFTSEDKPKKKRDAGDGCGIWFDVECVHATPRAILCRFGTLEAWVPQDAVHDDSEVYDKGHRGKLIVKAFFAFKLAARVNGDGGDDL